MAEIAPFPLARRLGLIRHQARWYVRQSPHAGEVNLERQIEVQRATMLRRGIARAVVERECREMEAAIRAAAGQPVGRRNG